MDQNDKKKLYLQIGDNLILIGASLIILTIVVNVGDIVRGNLALKQFERQKSYSAALDMDEEKDTDGKIKITNNVAGQKTDAESQAEVDEAQGEQDTGETGVSDVGLLDDQVLGVMKIDKISLKEALKEGVGRSVISSALGHMEGTAFPGEYGNCVVAGHRNYVFGKYFNRLDEIKVGDSIEIETMSDTFKYRVTDKFVVEPTEVSVTDPLEGRQLTLITCTPLFVGSHRLIVRAELVEDTLDRDI
jgi:sortase A